MKGWQLRRSVVIPHSIDLSAGHEMPSRNHLEQEYPTLVGKQVVAFIGRINWVKNLDCLIAAVGLIHKEGFNIALVCAGPDSEGYQKQLERIAADLGISSSVLFTGMLHGEQLQSVFARADVVSLVSRKENFGLSAAEALAAGVPIVLSDGVDMGEDWPTPPVWRVKQDERSIADGLLAALEYARSAGTPTKAARDLAQREWGTSHSDLLIGSFESVLAGGC
jgi:glycosyltransferase involved in cell wall biosynthesis